MSKLNGPILITGGAGFIGSALIWALNRRGIDDIIVTDLLGTDEKWKNLVPLQFKEYLEADQLLARLDTPLLREVSHIFHLGACSSTTERDARYLIQNNYQYTCELARWSIATQKRFVYASSAATYGDGSEGLSDRHDHLDRLIPLNMYGYSKHLFDKYAARMGWLDRIVGLKYFNVFGPNENHKDGMRSVVSKAFEQISSTGSVELFKSHRPDYRDGEQKRDFLYVKDAVEMTLHLAETGSANGLFNLGTGTASTWLDLIVPVFHSLNRAVSIKFIDMPEELRGKYQYYTCADVTRLNSTGWKGLKFTLAQAVTDYVQNYLVSGLRLGQTLTTAG